MDLISLKFIPIVLTIFSLLGFFGFFLLKNKNFKYLSIFFYFIPILLILFNQEETKKSVNDNISIINGSLSSIKNRFIADNMNFFLKDIEYNEGLNCKIYFEQSDINLNKNNGLSNEIKLNFQKEIKKYYYCPSFIELKNILLNFFDKSYKNICNSNIKEECDIIKEKFNFSILNVNIDLLNVTILFIPLTLLPFLIIFFINNYVHPLINISKTNSIFIFVFTSILFLFYFKNEILTFYKFDLYLLEQENLFFYLLNFFNPTLFLFLFEFFLLLFLKKIKYSIDGNYKFIATFVYNQEIFFQINKNKFCNAVNKENKNIPVSNIEFDSLEKHYQKGFKKFKNQFQNPIIFLDEKYNTEEFFNFIKNDINTIKINNKYLSINKVVTPFTSDSSILCLNNKLEEHLNKDIIEIGKDITELFYKNKK